VLLDLVWVWRMNMNRKITSYLDKEKRKEDDKKTKLCCSIG